MKAKRTGSAFTYERGDRVETPFGEATIETDPDDHGRCKIRVAAFDEKENPVSATTFQFGKIIAKRDATGPEAFKARRLKKPDLSPRGPYASAEDIGIARERGTTVKQVRQERADDDMAVAPPIRKIASKSHRCFGTHSRMLTPEMIDASSRLQASGRRAGSKQIAPGEYGRQKSDFRTRAERKNAAERRHDGEKTP